VRGAVSAFVGDVIAGHRDPFILQAAESAGGKTPRRHMVEAVQDVMADFMPPKADSSMREGQATPRLTSP